MLACALALLGSLAEAQPPAPWIHDIVTTFENIGKTAPQRLDELDRAAEIALSAEPNEDLRHVLRSRGVSAPTCVLAALLAVVPQPLSAMAAFSFASRMAALQTVFVGFAAGLMLMIALTELLPDALSSPSKKNRDVSAAVACLAAVACVCGSSALME